jgi:hypothetical protein
MIKTQIIIENDKPKAVILDYKEYLKLKEKADEREDYNDGINALHKSKKMHKLADVEKKLGI